jgi:hypothetical protein
MQKQEKVKYKVSNSNLGYYTEYYEYLKSLFCKARDNGGIQFIFTLLRVSGIQDGGWDPFEEARESLLEFSKILRKNTKMVSIKIPSD